MFSPNIIVSISFSISFLSFFINNRHFLPFGRADLTAPASLRPIRGGDHSFMVRALHLQQPRLVNNPGKLRN
jgi:hypothetical protein